MTSMVTNSRPSSSSLPPISTQTPTNVSASNESSSKGFSAGFIKLAKYMCLPNMNEKTLLFSQSILKMFCDFMRLFIIEFKNLDHVKKINTELNLELHHSSELLSEFYIRLATFNGTENRIPFIDLVKSIFRVAIEENKKDPLQFFSYKIILSEILTPAFVDEFLTSPRNLLEEPTINFLFSNYTYSTKNRFRIAGLRNCYLRFDFEFFIKCNLALNEKLATKTNFFDSFPWHQLILFTGRRENLTPSQKIILYRFFRKNYVSFFKELHEFNKYLNLTLKEKFIQTFFPLIKSREAQAIAGLGNTDNRDIDQIPYNPYYIQNNRLIYDNFILKVKKIMGFVEEFTLEGEKKWSLIKNFFPFMCVADISSLLDEEAQKKPFGQIEKILFEELEKFTQKTKEDRTLLSKVTQLYQDPQFTYCKDLITYCTHTINYFKKMHLLTRGLMSPSILAAELVQNDLDILPIQPTHPVKIPSTKTQKNKEKEKEIDGSPSISLEKSDEPETPVISQPIVATPPTPLEQLQKGREVIVEVCTQLAKKCQAYHAKEALIDAQDHLEQICCGIQRFFREKEKPMAPSHLFFFVIDCLRHGTLALEQMLCAINRESNQITNQEELNEQLTHNLSLILMNCQLNERSFSPKISDWIRRNNHGEVIVRGTTNFIQKDSIINDIFQKARSYNHSQASIQPEEFMKDLFTYLIQLTQTCEQLKKQLMMSLNIPSKALDTLESLIPSLEAFSNELCSLKWLPENNIPPSELLTGLKEKIVLLKENPYVNLENLIENLIPHLEHEIANQKTLHPLDAHLHLGNVLLLTQMIVEEILIYFVDDVETELERKDHDLVSLINKLNIPQEKFTPKEKDFLKRGHAMRLLVRYPANFQASYQPGKLRSLKKILDTYSEAKKLSRKEKLTQLYHVEDGFQLCGQLEERLEKIKQMTRDDVLTMTGLLSKVLEVKSPHFSDKYK